MAIFSVRAGPEIERIVAESGQMSTILADGLAAVAVGE